MAVLSGDGVAGGLPPARPTPAGLLVLASHLACDLADEGHPFPQFAAVLLAIRGERGLDQSEFACLLGVPPSLVRGLETGVVAPSASPPGLVNLMADLRRAAA